jgi:tRNA (cmo5U34)-methyltransferase
MDHIRKAFDAVAGEYDAQRKWVIPQLREFYGAAVWAAESAAERLEILEIGAGTGLFSAMLLEKFPGASLTLMDISENMLAVARQRFSGRENIRYVVADYCRSDLGGPYDLVCSALSIHHLTDEDKRRLYAAIHRALKPGGMLVNADQADAGFPPLDRHYREYWDGFVEGGPLSADEKREIARRRATLDRNATLSDQLAWLRECGFTGVDVVYRNRVFAVMVAVKE